MTVKLTPKQLEWLSLNNKEYPIKCKMCDNNVKWRYLPGGGMFNTYCSSGCAKLDKKTQLNKQRHTMLQKYGINHNWNIGALRDKQQHTMLQKYGNKHPLLIPIIKEKLKQTNLEKYGVDNPLKHPQIQQSAVNTRLQKYGVEYTAQSPELFNKMKQTNIERYGVEYATQHSDIKERIKQTNLEKYGVEWTQQNEDVRLRGTQTNLIKYGTNYVKQSHMIDILPLIEDYGWLFDQYITQNKTATQIADELSIDGTTLCNYLRKAEIEIRQYYWYSYKSVTWLELIMEQEGIYIQHAMNGGEYSIPGTRYKADGYCAQTNTIYEFYGDYWHGNPTLYEPDYINESTNCNMNQLYQKTIIRENQIISLGYNLVSIWENDFNNLTINQ